MKHKLNSLSPPTKPKIKFYQSLYHNYSEKLPLAKNKTINATYYKDPFFYNKKNLQKQCNFLSNLPTDVFFQKNSPQFSTFYDNPEFPSITYKTHFNQEFPMYNLKNTTLSDLNSSNQYSNLYNMNTNLSYFNNSQILSQFISSSTDHSRNRSGETLNSTINSNALRKYESDDFYYKTVFKMKPLFRRRFHCVDNKLNMRYAENEKQYEQMLKKENKLLVSQGKRPIIKSSPKYIREKIGDIKDRIRFMKGVVDFSYPSFVLTKIKAIDKLMKLQEEAKKLNTKLLPVEAKNQTMKLIDSQRFNYLNQCINVVKERNSTSNNIVNNLKKNLAKKSKITFSKNF